MGAFASAVSVLVESLLLRGGDAAISEAEDAVSNLADFAAGSDFVFFGVLVLRLRAMIAGATRDETAFRELVERYRATAESFGYDEHVAMAQEMQKSAGQGI